uniref:Uncharacterized protein n=1 Tax=viral metagenome TaxID=1070528 RepID=A0A6M3JR35_9ZZZZ
MVKLFVKNATIFCFIVGIIISTSGCWATKLPTKPPKEITHWVGDKESIKKYLDSPFAQAERYLIEAIK